LYTDVIQIEVLVHHSLLYFKHFVSNMAVSIV